MALSTRNQYLPCPREAACCGRLRAALLASDEFAGSKGVPFCHVSENAVVLTYIIFDHLFLIDLEYVPLYH